MENKELIKKNKQIKELEKIIKDLNIKLNESEALKGNFISNIMNEVYNPFSSIISMADNILSLNENNLQKALPMAKIIYREAAQLDFHLQNVFAAANIEAGLEESENTNININDIFETVLNKLRFDINNKELKIVSNLNNNDISFISDPKKLTLILLNLLSNSIKFSPQGDTITCNFEYLQGFFNITISDNGKGISDDDMKLIYNRFSKIDNTINSVIGGSGLGLSVVKALTEILNGNINITSNKGTKVTVAIPESNEDDDDFEDDEILFDEEIF